MLVACFTKESTLVMVPISLAWWLIAWLGRSRHIIAATFVEKVTRWIVLTSVLTGGLYYLARSIFITPKIIGVGQASSFSFDSSQILDGLVRWGGWLMRDFIWLAPMAFIVFAWCLVKKRSPRSGLWWFAGVWMAVWLGLYIPWYFGVEYYLFPFAAGAAVLAGVLLVELVELVRDKRIFWKVTGFLTLGLTCLLLLATQANSIVDASVQLAQDTANTSVMEYVVKNAPIGSIVLVNIQLSNEYIEQMEFLLVNDYHRTDLQFDKYQGQDLSLLTMQYPAVFILVADVENQPKMTVRMGFIEDSLHIWNSILLPKLTSWSETFQVTRDAALLIVDFPRLLCSVINKENYCSPGGGLVSYQIFRYQWTIYTAR
jgi:hypothetical protein